MTRATGMAPSTLAPDLQIARYRRMLLIRRFEERVLELRIDGVLEGVVHPYIGQEAVAVGACAQLRRTDSITSTHRGHGHCIAKGADPGRMMAELFGRVDGYCGGKGGSMHIADFEIGMLGANGIVAAGLPIGAGAALAERPRTERRRHRLLLQRGRRRRGPVPRGAERLGAVAAAGRLPVREQRLGRRERDRGQPREPGTAHVRRRLRRGARAGRRQRRLRRVRRDRRARSSAPGQAPARPCSRHARSGSAATRSAAPAPRSAIPT